MSKLRWSKITLLNPDSPRSFLSCLRRSSLTRLGSALVVAIASGTVVNAQAEDFAVTADYSLFYGAGIAGSYRLMPKMNARLGWHPQQKFYNFSKTSNGFDVKGDAKFGYLGIFADFFPTENNFRLTVGVSDNSNSKITAAGKASSSAAANSTISALTGGGTQVQFGGKTYEVVNNKSYTYNGTTYYAYNGGIYTSPNGGGTTVLAPNSNLNSLVTNATAKADVKWPSTAIYLGLGYGNPVSNTRGWGFWADAGVFLSSKPKVTSTVTNNCTGSNNVEACNVLTQELSARADEVVSKVKDTTDKLGIIPTLAVGVSYSF